MVQRNRRAIREGVGHDRPGPDPAQALALELELADRRRRDGHRVESRAVIVNEPGKGGLNARRRTARTGRVLTDGDLQPGPSQMDRADEARRTRTDDDDTPITRHEKLSTRMAPCYPDSRSFHGASNRVIASTILRIDPAPGGEA